jgi:iron complex transport system substrate-binding protein
VGDRVVGVTPYCNYPAEARDLPKIGGLLDPNFEALVVLEPDLVVLLQSAAHHRPALERLGLTTLAVPHRSLEGMLRAITMLGTAVGREKEAERIVADFRTRLERVERRVAGRGRPRVLVVIERDYAAGLDSMTVAASDAANDLYDRAIEIAGGRNACPRTAAPFPPVSTEGLLWMDPDVIVELVPPAGERSLDLEAIRRQWQELPELEAVKKGCVYVIDDEFAMIPGPRFVRLVEKLAKLLHPES